MGFSAVQVVGASSAGLEFLLLAVALACSMAWQYHSNKDATRLSRRVGRHAQSIANMDDWADIVDMRLSLLEAHRDAANLNDAAPAEKGPGLGLAYPAEGSPAKLSNAPANDKAKALPGLKQPPVQQPAAKFEFRRGG